MTQDHRHAADGRPRRGPGAQRQRRRSRTPVDDEPGGRPGAEVGEHGEGGDAEHRPADVDGVGAQRRHRAQQRAERQRERRHERGDQDDEQRQDDEVDVRAVRGVEAEEDLAGVAGLDVELGAVDEEDGHEQERRERRERRAARPRRPSRMPRPMPRKLAISRKLLKKPTYLTFAGIQRMRSSSTNRSVALVRKSRTRRPGERPDGGERLAGIG